MAHCNAVRKSKAGAEVTLPLTSIVRDPLLRSRVGPLDGDHVAGMAESITAGHPPPRPSVFHIAGRGHFLVGGFHTLAAYEEVGESSVPVSVRPGTWEEAVEFAASQNQDHERAGKKRTNADKRHAAMMVLTVHPEWTDRRVADYIGVHHQMVGVARGRLEEARKEVDDSSTSTVRFREGAGGKKYVLPVPDRTRPSSRKEHEGANLTQSWEQFGASVLPLLENDIPLPKVLAANQLNLKQLSAVIGRLLDLFDGPQYDDVYRRLLTDAEKASRLEWLITNLFPELYVEGAVFGEQLEVLRDARFPAGALP